MYNAIFSLHFAMLICKIEMQFQCLLSNASLSYPTPFFIFYKRYPDDFLYTIIANLNIFYLGLQPFAGYSFCF